MSGELFFEDINVGQVFDGGDYYISMEDAVGFANQYDPQYFHTDEQAALDSPFGKLAASGWQTAAITMRLKAHSGLEKVHRGLIGLGLKEMKWPKAVYPGDTLYAKFTITGKRRSQSKPTHGVVEYDGVTTNQHGEVVMTMKTSVWVPCRDVAA